MPERVDVAGVKLGMSPDEVRAVLKSKKLIVYFESAEILVRDESNAGTARGRFVNLIETWTAPRMASSAVSAGDGESYEVMFTPVPGKERAMAIVHTVYYLPGNAVRETALDQGLAVKYGGFPKSEALPGAVTWRMQANGAVETGDACNRRGIFGGLADIKMGDATRRNLALQTAPDEFRFQIEHCGVAIVTEDHGVAKAGESREARRVSRYTVTAYSPTIGLDGATTAAQLIGAASNNVGRDTTAKPQDAGAPIL